METRINDIASKVNQFCMDYDHYNYVDEIGLDSTDIDANIEKICNMIKSNDIKDMCNYLKELDVDKTFAKNKVKGLIKEVKECAKEYKTLTSVKKGTLKKYEILGDGAHGGLSESKLAKIKSNDEKVFIKVVNDSTSIYARCLISEAKILGKLKGIEGVANKVDFFENQGKLYLVEKMIDGKTLKDALPDLDSNERQSVYKDILTTMKEIHSKGIVHRDLKPNNILIDSKGKVHIIDFNISSKQGEEIKFIAGNRKFGSPEQLTYDNIADVKNDVYALGKLYEFVFEKTNELSRMATEVNADCRCNLDDIITEFNKEMTLVEPAKEDRKMTLASLISEAKARTTEVGKTIASPVKQKDQALEI